ILWVNIRASKAVWRSGVASSLALFVHLAEAGCATVYFGGSFVTAKANPGDIDVTWDLEGVDPTMLIPAFRGPDGIEELKWIFGGHFFPSELVEGDSGMTFVEFFQQTKDGRPVGIVQIDLTTLED
ncbi:MAG: hypothetical protein ABI634_18245, partial [Acidobacteriota bacterium]